MCTFINEFCTDATLYMHGEAARANDRDLERGNCAANAISARGVTPYADCILSNVISRQRKAVSDSHGARAQTRKRREKNRVLRGFCVMCLHVTFVIEEMMAKAPGDPAPRVKSDRRAVFANTSRSFIFCSLCGAARLPLGRSIEPIRAGLCDSVNLIRCAATAAVSSIEH